MSAKEGLILAGAMVGTISFLVFVVPPLMYYIQQYLDYWRYK